MRSEVLPYLRCPVCRDLLTAGDGGPPPAGPAPPRTLRCPRGHSFDVARQGYVHLAGRTPHSGDTAAMVAARTDFLATGHYDFLSAALASAASAHGVTARPLVVDAGAGTGHHLAAVLDALPDAVGLALDASKPAVRRAGRSHPRAGAVLCDTWGRLPLADDAAAVLLNVFAPRNGAEFRRVLRPDGLLLVVTPGQDHLRELVTALDLLRVDPEKSTRVIAELSEGFVEAGRDTHRRALALPRSHVRTLVEMGPSAWHTDPDDLAARIARLPDTIEVTASLRLGRYLPRPDRP